MSEISDIVCLARKFAVSVERKDEGTSIIVNALCSIIEELEDRIQLKDSKDVRLMQLLRKVFEDFILEGDYDEKIIWLAEVEQLLKEDRK